MLKEFGFAPGIEERGVFTSIRNISSPEIWDAVIHKHLAEKAGPHFDLRLHDPQTSKVHSFVITHIPIPGEKVLAIEQQIHDPSAMSFTGVIPKGQYGAGSIEQVLGGKIEVLKADPSKITFIVLKAGTPDRYTLIQPASFEDKNWLLINHTPTQTTRPEIPSTKPKYRETAPSPSSYLSPKIDGAHAIIALRRGKSPEVFSYRKSKKSDKLIDHTFKIPNIRTPSPIDKTILRGELFARNPDTGKSLPSPEIAGMLNATTLKSREMQKERGNLEAMIFDIHTYRGKDVSTLPYSEKLKILETITTELPELKTVPLARTQSEKELLLASIRAGENPLTQEGVVSYNLNSPIPDKLKFKKDTDLRVLGFFPPSKGSKYEGKGVGGILAAESSSSPTIRIGTGISDAVRREFYLHPSKYVGRLAKVEYQSYYPKTKKFRMPVFKEMREWT